MTSKTVLLPSLQTITPCIVVIFILICCLEKTRSSLTHEIWGEEAQSRSCLPMLWTTIPMTFQAFILETFWNLLQITGPMGICDRFLGVFLLYRGFFNAYVMVLGVCFGRHIYCLHDEIHGFHLHLICSFLSLLQIEFPS